MLLIDPYTYGHLSFKEIRTVNRVADHIIETYEKLDVSLLVASILANYREGMTDQALSIHVKRQLQLV
jgi:hypothetical protein